MVGNRPPDKPKQSAIIALMGMVAAGQAVALISQWEGTRLQPYRDVVGIWTVCTGDTHDVVPGRRETVDSCNARLERQIIAHAKPVMQCVPGVKEHPYVLAASASLAYNIGAAGFCRSSAARAFRAGRWREGCDAFLRWSYAGGRQWPGLVRRRAAERAICLRDAAGSAASSTGAVAPSRLAAAPTVTMGAIPVDLPARMKFPRTKAVNVDLLALINRAVNHAMTPMSDKQHYGREEMWVMLPADGKGDCEDYALSKLALLTDAGFPTVLFARIRGVLVGIEGHAILELKMPDSGEIMFLDNRFEEPMTRRELVARGYKFLDW